MVEKRIVVASGMGSDVGDEWLFDAGDDGDRDRR